MLAEPDFLPSDDEQGQLDEIKPYFCPHCREAITIEQLRKAQSDG